MARSYIESNEGKVVYIHYEFKSGGSTGVRGIVYQHTCYEIKPSFDGRDNPTITLEPIAERWVRDVRPLQGDLGSVEKVIQHFLDSKPETLEQKITFALSVNCTMKKLN